MLGAKLDDVSVALGSALLTLQAISPPPAPPSSSPSSSAPAAEGAETQPSEPMEVATDSPSASATSSEAPAVPTGPTVGLTSEQVVRAKEREERMRASDKEIRELHHARNEMEAFILEMRGARSRKHGALRLLDCDLIQSKH